MQDVGPVIALVLFLAALSVAKERMIYAILSPVLDAIVPVVAAIALLWPYRRVRSRREEAAHAAAEASMPGGWPADHGFERVGAVRDVGGVVAAWRRDGGEEHPHDLQADG